MSQIDPADDNPYTSPAEAGIGDNRSSDTAKWIVAVLKFGAITILIGFLLDVLNVVSFSYRKSVDNDPLSNSVRVVRLDLIKEELELADGRLVTDYWEGDRLADVMKRYQTTEVEIVPAPDDVSRDRVEVYAKDFNFICRVGLWDPLVTIPLIPIHEQRFKRVRFGTGKCEETGAYHE